MKLTRICSVLLILLLLCSFSACEKIDLSGGKPSDSPDAPSGEKRSELVVKTTLVGNDAFRPAGSMNPTTERILNQISAAETATGYKVNVEMVSAETLSTAFARACRSGAFYTDVIQTDATFLTTYYAAGYLLPLTKAGLEESETGVLRSPDGTAYALRADGWNNPLPTLSYLLYYNEKILTDSGCETPLELQEAGVWNWEQFEKLCKKVTAANQKEIYAIAEPTREEPALIWATLHGANAKYFKDDGTCVMDSPEALTGFGALKSFLASGVTYALNSEINSTADTTAKLAFTNRRTAFLVENSQLLFASDETSLTQNLQQDLRIIGFPTLNPKAEQAAFAQQDVFCGITDRADVHLCQALLPLLFAPSEEVDSKAEVIDEHFYHAEDGELYFDLLSSADTDTSLVMGEHRSLVEDFFVQVAKGGSAKEILNNLQIIFNESRKG